MLKRIMKSIRKLGLIIEKDDPVKSLFSSLSSVRVPEDVIREIPPEDKSLLYKSPEQPATEEEATIERLGEAFDEDIRIRESHLTKRLYEAFIDAINKHPNSLYYVTGRILLEVGNYLSQPGISTFLVDRESLYFTVVRNTLRLSGELSHIRNYNKLFLEGGGNLSDEILRPGTPPDLRGVYAQKLGIPIIYLDRGPNVLPGSTLNIPYNPKTRESQWAELIDKNLSPTEKSLLIASIEHFRKSTRGELELEPDREFYGDIPQLLKGRGIELYVLTGSPFTNIQI